MEQPPPQQPPLEDALDLIDASHTSSSSSSFSFLRRCSLSLPSPHDSPHLHRIPGPAGAIQAAMHRKDRHAPPHSRHSDDFSDGNKELVEISTQEYLRRVEEDSGEEFSRDPWIFAIDSLRRCGEFDATALKDVKKCMNAERIDQVVAVVKSCTPNGLGDMIVTLKDPTDTVGASVHRKVLNAGEFGKSITAGSVLILQKVVVFPSSYASCCLNITTRNVVKVYFYRTDFEELGQLSVFERVVNFEYESSLMNDFCLYLISELEHKERPLRPINTMCASLLLQVISVDCEVQNFADTNLDRAQVFRTMAETPENTTALMSRSRRLSEDDQLSCNVSANTAMQKPKEWETSTQASSLSSGTQIESSAYKISKEPILKDHVDSGHKALGSLSQLRDNSGRVARPGPDVVVAVANFEDGARDGNSHAWQQNGPELERLLRGKNCTTSMTGKRRNLLQNGPELDRSTQNDAQKHGRQMDFSSGPSLVDNVVDRETAKPNDSESTGSGALKKQRLGLISRTSVQEWTDEQLCVLEMDDD
ncbi:hypothetical protein RND81_09G001900 [Saponaria officinalis]|uniref:Homologous recombination OB-fold protein OB-fold domain-containing protein n=1 Tax=Saponaria officinalis TaxID=3572 RepID=A0AAW1IG78_SAPOF